jgi:hypothetical protein
MKIGHDNIRTQAVLPIVFLTGIGDIRMGVAAMKADRWGHTPPATLPSAGTGH